MWLEAGGLLIGLLLVFVLWGRAVGAREIRLKRTGAFAEQFVLIDDDGCAHELSRQQRAYLNTEFHPADGARPYYKSSYSQRTPVGKLGGYLKRRQVPDGVPIQSPLDGS